MSVPRTERVEGHPIKCYDNGGRSIDRYTVVFMDQPEAGRGQMAGLYGALGMNGSPFHPQGFCQHTYTMVGSHLGRKIAFADLPLDCQRAPRLSWRWNSVTVASTGSIRASSEV